jgi:uncharacterized protein (DUF1697 family)
MTVFIALLRAVNVGGSGKIAMADLRAMAEDMGLETPRTLLQSGNLVFGGRGGSAALEARLEAETAKRFGLKTSYLVRTAAEWGDLIAANPFPEEAKADPSHMVAMPLKEAPPAAAVSALRAAIKGRETVECTGRTLYLVYPDGIGTSKLTIAVIEKKLGTVGTGRNWNTVLKLAALAAG